MTEILAWSVIGCWILWAALICYLWTSCKEEAESPTETQFGISPESVHVSSTGYLLEFRFHVLDPERAEQWLATDGHACLMDSEGDTVLISLGFPGIASSGGIGPALAWGDTRSILFADPERGLNPPSRAVFAFGDIRIGDLEIVRGD